MIPSRRATAAVADGPGKAARAAAALAALIAGPAFLLMAGQPAAAAPPTITTTTPVQAVARQATQVTQGDVKFYIVPPPVNGEKEFLFEIARKTLGDGNRFPEIVELNRGRLQPDGGRLDNPDNVMPGWILQLPDDAAGPGVQEGPLPTVQQAPGNDDQGDVGVNPVGENPQNAPITPVASGAAASSGGSSTLLLVGGSVLAVLLAAAGIVLALLGRDPSAAGQVRAARPPKLPKQPKEPKEPKQPRQPRRRKEPSHPAEDAAELAPEPESQPQSQAQPRPRARLAARPLIPSGRLTPPNAAPAPAPAPAPVAEPVAAPETVAAVLGVAEPAVNDALAAPPIPPAPPAPPAPAPPAAAPPAPAPPAAAPPAPPVPPPPAAPPAPPAAPPVADDVPPAPLPIDLPLPSTMLQTSVPSLSNPAGAEQPVVDDHQAPMADPDPDPEPVPFADEVEPDSPPAPLVDDQPAPPPAPALSFTIVEQVSFGDDVIQVQMATASPDSAPVEWTPMPYDVPQDGVAYVCLGASDKGCLFVDLGRAPGPVSIGGDPEAAARLVESIAFQLSAALEPHRASVTVVGDIGKSMELGLVTRASTLSQVVSRGSTAPEGAEAPLELLICSRESARDDTALAWLTSDQSRRIVPIVIGNLPTALWSLTAGNVEQQSNPVAHNHEAAGV